MKKAILLSTLIAGSATLGLGLVAIAQDSDMPPPPQGAEGHPPPPHHGMMLEELDTDKDGNISIAEIEAKDAQAFAEIDANGDGQLTVEEMSAFADAKKAERKEKMRERHEQRILAELDADEDGVISAEEFSSRPHKMFEKADANGDGVIDETEQEAMKKHFRGGKHVGKGGHHGDDERPPRR